MQSQSTSSRHISDRLAAASVIAALALVLAAACLAVVPAQAHAVTASNGAKVTTIKFNKTYTTYDITNDGKADKLKVKLGDFVTGDMFTEYTVYVNGKAAYTGGIGGFKKSSSAAVVKLKNGKYLLYVLSGYGGSGDGGDVLLYDSGKMKVAFDSQSFVAQKYCRGQGAKLSKVSGNTLTMHCAVMTLSIQGFECDLKYAYKSGSLKRVGDTAKITKVYGTSGTHKALTKVTAYKNAQCKAKKFTVKKGQKTTFPKVYISGNKLSIQVKAGGKTGWIKCATGSSSAHMYKNGPLFSGMSLLG